MRSRFPATEAPNRDYSDFRSSTQSRKRGRDRYHKYLKFQLVDEGQRTTPQAGSCAMRTLAPYQPIWPLKDDDQSDILPKRDFLDAARSVPYCWHGRHCPVKRDKRTIHRVEWQRGSRYARELARSYLKTGCALRPVGWRGDVDFRMDAEYGTKEPYICEDYCRFRTSWDDERGQEVMESYGCCCCRLAEEADDDRESIVSDQTGWMETGWEEIESVASWDDCDVTGDDLSEWSEVDGGW